MEYEDIIQKETRFYDIKIAAKRKNKTSYTYFKQKKLVSIPVMDSDINLLYGLHAISYYIVLKERPVFVWEYKRVKWVIDRLNYYDIPISNRMSNTLKFWAFYAVAKAHNRKGDVSKIPEEVREYLKSIVSDFNEWRGHSIEYRGSGYLLVPNKDLKEIEKTRVVKKRERIAKAILKKKK